MGVAYTLAYALALATFAYVFLPSLWLFLFGVESGMNHIDRVYPYPQARKPLHEHPALIYTHMYANIIALGIQLSLLSLHPPTISKTVHRRLAWTYTLLVIPEHWLACSMHRSRITVTTEGRVVRSRSG